jgi:hypothetical protein
MLTAGPAADAGAVTSTSPPGSIATGLERVATPGLPAAVAVREIGP